MEINNTSTDDFQISTDGFNWTVWYSPLLWYGVGNTKNEAIKDFIDTLVEFADELEKEENLSQIMKDFLGKLNLFIHSTATVN